MKYSAAKTYILRLLKRELPSNLHYHGLHHTWDVYNSAKLIALNEGITEHESKLLLTAALFHDTGYIKSYLDNESIAIDLVKEILPSFGFKNSDIALICSIIESTIPDRVPQTMLEKIMSDADHDYFGRSDYHLIADSFKRELVEYNIAMSDKMWIEKQLDYLENRHRFLTETSIGMRVKRKKKNILDLREKLKDLP
ncbi:HD domain-containing protein [Flavobacteriales bacterium]|nr:HD domain-containing protein [Flavobacteriales bacterium]MDC3336537.1 HD domain-containing protein [Flavobacteriales bacterium]